MNIDFICKLAHSFHKLAGQPSAGCLFFCPEDETVLLIRRSQQMSSPGTWDIPGGQAKDKDKNPEETAAREVTEEIGSIPENKKLIGKHHIDNSGTEHADYIVFIYAINKSEKGSWKIKLDKESDAKKWFKYNELPEETHFDLSWIPKKVS